MRRSVLHYAFWCLTLLACEGYRAAPTQVRSSPVDEKTEAYFAGPWPDDHRLLRGALTTRRFPRPGNGALQENVLTSADRLAKGWGLSAPLFVPFDGPIDPASLPAAPNDAQAADASVYLVDLDPESPTYAQRHPVDFRFYEEPTLYLPGQVLAVRPFPGSPLRAKTRYALVVTTRVRDAQGRAVGPEPWFWKLLHGEAVDELYAPFLDWVRARKVDRSTLAGAFVFTTQPLLDELAFLADWLEAQPAPPLQGLSFASTQPRFHVFEGTYPAPYLQHGTVPFSTSGGDFRFDDAGQPIASYVEDMRVALCVPKGPPPPAGFPVVLYAHGTGGNFRGVIRDICDDLAAVGIAAASIDQVFHGPRARGATAGCFGQSIELCFFNPVNAVAGRNSARMAALDNVMLRKMLAAATVPSALHPEGHAVRFFADEVGFFGHSQGGLTGSLYVAVAPQVKAAVLSGAGGHLTTTVLERTDPFSVREMAEGPLLLGIEGKESLEPFHPALALIQALGDAADPQSYARHWVTFPRGAPKHLYVTSGLDDPYTPAFTAEALAAAGQVPQLAPEGRPSTPHAVRGLSVVAAPVRDNAQSSSGQAVTAVFRQFPGEGHFPVFRDATSRAQWQAFFDQALHGRPVEVAR